MEVVPAGEGSWRNARALLKPLRFDQPDRFIAKSEMGPVSRSISSPNSGCTSTLRQALTNSTVPDKRRWSVRPRAGIPLAWAACASSAGKANPSWSEYAE